jgi:hypothetical protein
MYQRGTQRSPFCVLQIRPAVARALEARGRSLVNENVLRDLYMHCISNCMKTLECFGLEMLNVERQPVLLWMTAAAHGCNRGHVA